MAYDPKDAVRHIVHDYVYLMVAGTDTQRGNRHPFNHYAERTFHVHCRAMDSFFSGKGNRKDVYARDFTKSPFTKDSPIWTQWRDHIDKHLMHLTQGRISNTIPWTGEPNKEFLREFREAWAEFLSNVRDDLKPLFEQEMVSHRQSYPNYPL